MSARSESMCLMVLVWACSEASRLFFVTWLSRSLWILIRLRSWSDNSVALDSNVSGFEHIRLIRRAILYGTFLLQCYGEPNYTEYFCCSVTESQTIRNISAAVLRRAKRYGIFLLQCYGEPAAVLRRAKLYGTFLLQCFGWQLEGRRY